MKSKTLLLENIQWICLMGYLNYGRPTPKSNQFIIKNPVSKLHCVIFKRTICSFEGPNSTIECDWYILANFANKSKSERNFSIM